MSIVKIANIIGIIIVIYWMNLCKAEIVVDYTTKGDMMSEKWDKQALCDYLPTLLSNFKGNQVYVNVFYSKFNHSIEIEITEVKSE